MRGHQRRVGRGAVHCRAPARCRSAPQSVRKRANGRSVAHNFLRLEIPSKRSQRGVRFRRVTPPHVLRSGTNPPAWRTVRRWLRKMCKRSQRGAQNARANGRSVARIFRKMSKRPQRGNRSGNEQTAAAWHTFLKSSEHRANGRSVAYVFGDSRCRVD